MKGSRFVRLLLSGAVASVVFLTLVATAPAATGGRNVFVLGNQLSNKVKVFARAHNGSVRWTGTYLTGGKGTDARLGSLGGLKLSPNGRWLFAVNPASDSITVFAVYGHKLRRTDVEPCGGSHPVSLAYHERKLYVLNTGGAGNVCGFELSPVTGKLTPIDDSSVPLSNDGQGIAPEAVQIAFCSQGLVLVVTERDTGIISLYRMYDGRPVARKMYASAGATPEGFTFNRAGSLVVTESQGGVARGSSASSYLMSCSEFLSLKTRSVASGGTSASGAISLGMFVYVSNSSGSIAKYHVTTSGRLVLEEGKHGLTGSRSRPHAMASTYDCRNLYVLCQGTHNLCGFHVSSAGRLSRFTRAPRIPAHASAIAAW
jgi:6-phosphogluconolactonase